MSIIFAILFIPLVVALFFIGMGLYEFITEHRQDHHYHLDHLAKINKEPSK